MILIDTSVLIDYLRTKDPLLWQKLQTFAPLVCGLVRAEILAGARNPADRARLITTVNSFGQVTFDESWWDLVGDNAALFRANGIAVPISDVLIATAATANNLELWTRDSHFVLMQKAIPALRLFSEPP
jgi:predicted nucleic acid-binding protein